MSHTSSIREGEYKGVYASHHVQGDSPIALGGFLKGYLTPDGAHHSRKNFKKRCPGKSYADSNIGAGLLGYLTEEVAGVTFERFSEERLFQPLGMTDTAWRLAELTRTPSPCLTGVSRPRASNPPALPTFRPTPTASNAPRLSGSRAL